MTRGLTPNLVAAVREKARGYLAELAAEGDPFAADLLRNLPAGGDYYGRRFAMRGGYSLTRRWPCGGRAGRR
jgi:hypothetical protein